MLYKRLVSNYSDLLISKARKIKVIVRTFSYAYLIQAREIF